MEDIASQSMNLEIVKRLVIIITFLSLLWFGLNYLATKIKSGDISLPEFLRSKMIGSQDGNPAHHIEVIQRKHLVDGTEMLVVNVDGKDLLLVRNVNGSISFVKELDDATV